MRSVREKRYVFKVNSAEMDRLKRQKNSMILQIQSVRGSELKNGEKSDPLHDRSEISGTELE